MVRTSNTAVTQQKAEAEVSQYRNRQTAVEAFRMTELNCNDVYVWPVWLYEALSRPRDMQYALYCHAWNNHGKFFQLNTRDARRHVTYGQWIVRCPDGELQLYTQAEFERIYIPADKVVPPTTIRPPNPDRPSQVIKLLKRMQKTWTPKQMKEFGQKLAKLLPWVAEEQAVDPQTADTPADEGDSAVSLPWAPPMYSLSISMINTDSCYTVDEARGFKQNQFGGYVIPLRSNGDYYETYAAHVQDINNLATVDKFETIRLQQRVQDDQIQFVTQIAGREIVLVPDPEWPQLQYRGSQTGYGLNGPLRHMVPLVKDSLETLMEETGYVIVGQQRGD